MLSRRYNKIIEVWGTAIEEDGFGGNLVTDSKLGNSWCAIKTLSPQRITDLGLNDFKYAVQVDLRHRNDLDYFQEGLFLVYKGNKYTFNSVVQKDLEGVEIQIIAVYDE